MNSDEISQTSHFREMWEVHLEGIQTGAGSIRPENQAEDRHQPCRLWSLITLLSNVRNNHVLLHPWSFYSNGPSVTSVSSLTRP